MSKAQTAARKVLRMDNSLIRAHIPTAMRISAETLLGLMEAKILKWFEEKGTGFSCRKCPRVYLWTKSAGKPWTTLLHHIAMHEKEIDPNEGSLGSAGGSSAAA